MTCCGGSIKDVGLQLQKECLDWKYNHKKPMAKHPYLDWVKLWRNTVGGEERTALEEECLAARKRNKQWPVPANVPNAQLPKRCTGGGGGDGSKAVAATDTLKPKVCLLTSVHVENLEIRPGTDTGCYRSNSRRSGS